MAGRDGEGNRFSFFSHKDCEYFPCHSGVAPEEFNCLFCYCPLYALGKDCGGAYVILENGMKDCSRCTLPHRRENAGFVAEHFERILRLIRQKE